MGLREELDKGWKRTFVNWLTDWRIKALELRLELLYDRLITLEDYTMAADTEMLARLDSATSTIAARVQSLINKVNALDSEIAADAQSDAESLRPYVEQLEALGRNETQPVPPVEDGTPGDNEQPANPDDVTETGPETAPATDDQNQV